MVARIKVAEKVANTRLRMGEPPFCQVLAGLSAETLIWDALVYKCISRIRSKPTFNQRSCSALT